MADTRLSDRRSFAVAVWLTIAVLAGVVGFTAFTAVVDRMAQGWAAALCAGGAVVWWLRRNGWMTSAIPTATATFRRMFIAGAILLLVQVLALSAFIVNPNLGTWAGTPWRPWQSVHSCVSSYWVAATQVTATPNVYDDALYSQPQADRTARRQPRRMGPFNIDVYEYPPTFLPLPRLMAAATTDFWQFRRLWFALNLAGVALCVVAISRRFDADLGTQAVWLTPWVLVSPTIIGTLQAGNVQLLFIGAAAAAMLLFERRRHAAGGAILAYAIVSKLFPGVLLLYLLLRRDWRAVGWTAAWSLAIAAITLADVGMAPFAAFLEHFPKLLSGEAFPAFRNTNAIAVNESIPGLVFKVGLLGGPTLGFGASRILGWAYTLVVIGVTAWLALRPARRGREPLVWIVILVLATMRSPFLPLYATFPSLWLATLIAALGWQQPRVRWSAIGWWIVLAVAFGQSFLPPPVTAVWTFIHTIAAFVLVTTAIRRSQDVAESIPLTAALAEQTPATPVPG
jgi:alpha-1,2-mannosyltransferase